MKNENRLICTWKYKIPYDITFKPKQIHPVLKTILYSVLMLYLS